MRVVILMDNHGDAPFNAEHGYALWIEADGLRLLFDTGAGPDFLHNAKLLGIPVESADYIVLSHGHYDHTGGLPEAVMRATRAVVVYHEAVFRPRYSIRDGVAKPIGMPERSQAVLHELLSDRKIPLRDPLDLTSRVHVAANIPRTNDFEDTGGPFFLDEQGCAPDPLEDDLALWFETPQGIVLAVGCCHAGIINTCTFVRERARNAPFQMVLGGLHLLNADARRMEKTLQGLSRISPNTLVPCHCTGETASEILCSKLPARATNGHVGMQFVI